MRNWFLAGLGLGHTGFLGPIHGLGELSDSVNPASPSQSSLATSYPGSAAHAYDRDRLIAIKITHPPRAL